MNSSGVSGSFPLAKQVSGLRSSLLWLSERGVSHAALAALFGIKPDYVRQLVLRGKTSPFALYAPAQALQQLLFRPTDQMYKRLGIRKEDGAELTASQASTIDNCREKVDRIVEEAASFPKAAQQLRQLLPDTGFPSNPEWKRLQATIHKRMAWLLGHAGHSTSAYQEARVATDLWSVIYAEWNRREDLKQLGETCLIASNACLSFGDVRTAQHYLNIADQACEASGEELGSDHYRQRGVIQFLLGADVAARSAFLEATIAMQRKDEAKRDVDLLMTSKRYLAWLKPDWEAGLEVVYSAERVYPERSLHRIVAATSAAAAGLLTDSQDAARQALETLESTEREAEGFEHQRTRIALLRLTPELPKDVRPGWVRVALYENARKKR